MNGNLLIVGAGSYALVAAEIAVNMGCFEKIAFVDDMAKTLKNGIPVVGTTQDLERLAGEYSYVIVAIGNPKVRLSVLDRIQKETTYQIPSLVSPRAYVSSSAKVMRGCVVEPMAVVHSRAILEEGCIISAGAVVNHESTCCRGVHADCNSTVAAYARVPMGTKILSGEVYGDV
ncbi:MAG: hypothetical protein IJX01_08700 [Oscillospiraceae bacterium]|nr:hypothetical protein [Oscillospiraceae bacterium]